MLYKTSVAILHKGDRVPRGTELEMSQEDAARFGEQVVPAGEAQAEPVAEVEQKALEDMTKAELEGEAAKRGISTSGTKADLIERIQLHDAGPETDSDEAED